MHLKLENNWRYKKAYFNIAVKTFVFAERERENLLERVSGAKLSWNPRKAIPFLANTDKKNKIFLKYKEIQSGAVAKYNMRKSFLIYEEMHKYLTIYEKAVSHIWLCNCSILHFLIYEENLIFFFISVHSDLFDALFSLVSSSLKVFYSFSWLSQWKL